MVVRDDARRRSARDEPPVHAGSRTGAQTAEQGPDERGGSSVVAQVLPDPLVVVPRAALCGVPRLEEQQPASRIAEKVRGSTTVDQLASDGTDSERAGRNEEGHALIVSGYSALRADIGSTRVARRAGR